MPDDRTTVAAPRSLTSVTPLERLKPRRGAAIMLEVLHSEGCRYIFGNPGTTELPLIDALLETSDISYIWGLQEASVVAMADGYAQAAQRPGFINLHTAGGLGHGLGNLLNASVTGTPLVVTAGQQDSRHTITDPLLAGDLVRIAGPAVKWAQEVSHADQIPILVRRAFHDCAAPPTGPVFLSLPMDVMEELSSAEIEEPSVIDRHAIAGSLDRLADKLAAVPAGRIAMVAGDEMLSCDAAVEAVQVAETLGSPVFGSSWPAHIPFPTSHPLWSGNLPTRANEIAKLLGDYDAIFALGGKSVITILYTEARAVPAGCKVFQLSSDIRDLGRTYSTELSVMGDIKASLKVLLPLLRERLSGQAVSRAALVKRARREQTQRRAALADMAARDMARPDITPLAAAAAVAKAIDSAIPVVDEAVATSALLRQFLYSSWTRQYSFLRGGALGWGMPAAVGYSLGIDRAPVVSLAGDGAALYSPQALWTAARERLPVTFVVMNNREYNILKNFMKGQTHYASARSNRFIAMDIDDPAVDFLAMSRSFGVPAIRVERASDITAAIEAGIASGKPNLIEVPIIAT